MIESEGERQHATHRRLVVYDYHLSRDAPGDLIPTGTPFGVGFSRKPPVFLKDGDECVCEVEKVGSIRNRVRLAR